MDRVEKQEGTDAQKQGSEGIPLCPHCLTPFKPLQHYCEKCGTAVGRYTPYMPYVNIRFNVSIFGSMWKRLWRKDVSIPKKAFYVFMLVVLYLGVWPVLAPVLLIRLIWHIVKKLTGSGQRNSTAEEPD